MAHIQHQVLWAGILMTLLANGKLPHAQPFNILNFSKNDYGAAGQNWSVAFDTNGFANIANNLGLLEFDGITWSLHTSPNGSIIRAVAVDQNNRRMNVTDTLRASLCRKWHNSIHSSTANFSKPFRSKSATVAW